MLWRHPSQVKEREEKGPRGKIHPISPCSLSRSLPNSPFFTSSSWQRLPLHGRVPLPVPAMPNPVPVAHHVAYLFGKWQCVCYVGERAVIYASSLRARPNHGLWWHLKNHSGARRRPIIQGNVTRRPTQTQSASASGPSLHPRYTLARPPHDIRNRFRNIVSNKYRVTMTILLVVL